MTVSERISNEGLVELPPEAGDVNAPKFEPDETWLQEADAEMQKAAIWRWFATRHEHPDGAVPHDDEGNYLFGEGEPVLADQALHTRFGKLVPPAVIAEVVRAVQAEAGNEWVCKRMDKAGD